jgi:Winged helix DNA-binding domain
MAYTWEELAGLSLARQFPDLDGRGVAAVAETVRRIGPIQAQTARSPFLGLAARLPGVTLETVSSAYDDLLIVRGSNIRGTVHTSVPADNPLLEVATRLGNRTLWNRTLKLSQKSLEDVWNGIEDFARDEWRTPAELLTHLSSWIAEHDPGATPTLDNQAGRYFGFGHGGLLRRPLAGGWQSQAAPGYRTASTLIGDRTRVLADPEGSMDTLVRRHITSHGPSSRNDIAWWTGVGLRIVDASLGRLAEDLAGTTGPDGRAYHDLAGAPPPVELPGVRLLPEFDALLCGYDPNARERFVAPEHYRRLWFQGNGMLLAPLLLDGRLSGYWRMPGSGSSRPCEVSYFAGTRRPTKSELAEPVAALEAAYGITATMVSITRE